MPGPIPISCLEESRSYPVNTDQISPAANTLTSWLIAEANPGSYATALPRRLAIRTGPGSGQTIVYWAVSTPETAVLQSNPIHTANGWTAVAGPLTTNASNWEMLLQAVEIGFPRLFHDPGTRPHPKPGGRAPCPRRIG